MLTKFTRQVYETVMPVYSFANAVSMRTRSPLAEPLSCLEDKKYSPFPKPILLNKVKVSITRVSSMILLVVSFPTPTALKMQ